MKREAIHDGVGDGGVADDNVPVLRRLLGDHYRRFPPVPFLEDLEECNPGNVVERLNAEVVDDQELVFHNTGQMLEIGSVLLCLFDFIE